MKSLKLLLLTILLGFLKNTCFSLEICQKSPPWRLNGYSFLKSSRAHIKLVALLKSNCGFCLTQAKLLGELKNELENEGFKDIHFVIVNSHDEGCIGNSHIFRNVTTLDILQDISKVNVWKLYNGITDDMLIFDRCNRLVHHLTLPDSQVDTGSVKKFILEAYTNEKCGKTCAMFRNRMINKLLS